jgi:hypothetical protein
MSSPANPAPWLIVDGIGPFFRDVAPARINWSKIPFAELEKDGLPDRARWARIREDFRSFCRHAVDYGFNAITLDDLAHLVDHPEYPDALRKKIAAYQEEYDQLFSTATACGLRVLVTTDIMFFNSTLERNPGPRPARVFAFLEQALDAFFVRFPSVCGIVSRIGEADGVDVQDHFRSRLMIRNPSQARRCLRRLLPVFEKHQRWWIFRTWSVGAYRIGDLIWNRDTFHSTFAGIRSERLFLSMKYGETDFFRYLPLNRQFFRGHLPRIVELQARREYEGAGQYPAFIGADYEQYRNLLQGAPHLAGVMVWCQTGGWTRFRRLTFVGPSCVWNEINTWVSVRLFRDGVTAAQALESWCRNFAPGLDPARLLRLLRLSEEVVAELLYIDDFARRKIFFRRLRVPPLLSVFWDHVLINHPMRQFMRCFVRDGEAKVLQADRSLEKIREMRELASDLGLPVADIDFMYDTFEILAAARAYYFRDFTPAIVDRLTELRTAYQARHATRYSIHLDFRPLNLKRARLQKYLRLLLRQQRGYRLVDRLFTIRLLGWIYPLLRRRYGDVFPDFSRRQAMGIDSVFK